MFFCFILLYETQLRALCQHIFTFFSLRVLGNWGRARTPEWFYARPACVFSRRKSGAETSTVRHISYNLERIRLPILCSSASSRVGEINLPFGSLAVSPSVAGLSR